MHRKLDTWCSKFYQDVCSEGIEPQSRGSPSGSGPRGEHHRGARASGGDEEQPGAEGYYENVRIGEDEFVCELVMGCELPALAPLLQAGVWRGRHQDYQGRKSSTGRDGW